MKIILMIIFKWYNMNDKIYFYFNIILIKVFSYYFLVHIIFNKLIYISVLFFCLFYY